MYLRGESLRTTLGYLKSTCIVVLLGLPALTKPMARAGDEDVFQRRLAQRDGTNLIGKGFDQLADQAMSVGELEP